MVHIVAYSTRPEHARRASSIASPSDVRARLTEICVVLDDASTDDTFYRRQGLPAGATHAAQLRVFRNNTESRLRRQTRSSAIVTPSTTASTSWSSCTATASTRPRPWATFARAHLASGEADVPCSARACSRRARPAAAACLFSEVPGQQGPHALREHDARYEPVLSSTRAYRLYSVAALKKIPFEQNSDDFSTSMHADHHPAPRRRAPHQGDPRDPDVLRRRDLPPRQRHEVRVGHRALGHGVPHARGGRHAPPRIRARRARALRREVVGVLELHPHHRGRAAWGRRCSTSAAAGGHVARGASRREGCTVVGVDMRDNDAARAACAHASTVADLDGAGAASPWAPEERDFDAHPVRRRAAAQLRDMIDPRAQQAPGSSRDGKIVALDGATSRCGTCAFALACRGSSASTARAASSTSRHVHFYTRESFRRPVRERHGLARQRTRTGRSSPSRRCPTSATALKKALVFVRTPVQYALRALAGPSSSRTSSSCRPSRAADAPPIDARRPTRARAVVILGVVAALLFTVLPVRRVVVALTTRRGHAPWQLTLNIPAAIACDLVVVTLVARLMPLDARGVGHALACGSWAACWGGARSRAARGPAVRKLLSPSSRWGRSRAPSRRARCRSRSASRCRGRARSGIGSGTSRS